MANRVNPFTNIETLSGNISAATYFDNNIGAAFTALNDASLGYVNGISADTGSANNYIVTAAYGVPSAYNPGMTVAFLPANNNTGNSLITVNGVTPSQQILDFGGNQLLPGAIQSQKMTVLIYISGAFRLLYTSIPGFLFYNTVLGVGTTTINCAGYGQISILIDATQLPNSGTYTINITNVPWGAHFDVIIQTAGTAQIFKWSGTDQAGNTITPLSALYPVAPGGGGICTFNVTNLLTTGDSGAAHFIQYTGFLTFRQSVPQLTSLRFSAMFN